MFRLLSALVFGLLIVLPAMAEEVDILARLLATPGLANIEETTTETDRAEKLRRFGLTIEQPVDHFAEGSATFRQKLVLFHRDSQEPMVLQTSGYRIFGSSLTRLARYFATNQIQVEHRYFGDSSPAEKDWSKLTVSQSAADFHHIVETFKPIYPARWVNTGASKGGMTSVYHRRFYPNDLDGTVADVAPLSFSVEDPRYIDFVDQVGGDAYHECRDRLYQLQVLLFKNREALLVGVPGDFSMVGGIDRAFEDAVAELPFVFWQYGRASACENLPKDAASVEELQAFLSDVNGVDTYDDRSMSVFQPYYFQAATELGGPGTKLDHLAGLMRYPYDMDHLMPPGAEVHYTEATMRDVQHWVATQGKNLMFVYGEYDPWTAGAFRAINQSAGTDNHWFLQPKGNHGANFLSLSEEDRASAIQILSQWLNKAPVAAKPALFQGILPNTLDEPLEVLELKALRRMRVRF